MISTDFHTEENVPTTREDAFLLGSKYFWTGNQCPKGHVCGRYTNGSGCCECARNKERQRKIDNPEKYRNERLAAAKRWRQKNGNEVKRKWQLTPTGRAATRRWRENNPKKYWSQGAVQRMKKRDPKTDVNVEYMMSICPDVCPVFGTQLKYAYNDHRPEIAPSIDRINPNVGYIMGNIAVISWRANSIKLNCTSASEVRAVADWMEKQGR